ncbi:MAG: hypothetical protein KDA65_12285 [Planctomycetaceae bacterium]|nr:hypothetical protein [Planctomycetaceae bacterium]
MTDRGTTDYQKMPNERLNRFPRAIKIVALIMICILCFTVGRFVGVWDKRLSDKAKMNVVMTDSAKFESEMSDLLETIHGDLESFFNVSKQIIPEDEHNRIEHQLTYPLLWEENRRSLKDMFPEATSLEQLQHLASSYHELDFPHVLIKYDRSPIQAGTETPPILPPPIEQLYAGQTDSLKGLLPSLEAHWERYTNSVYTGQRLHERTMRHRDPVTNEPTLVTQKLIYHIHSHSEIHPEGAMLTINLTNDLVKGTLDLDLTFKEFFMKGITH